MDQSPLSPRTWPFDLAWLPETAHLVGGVVRDALLGRQPDYLDLDFVLPEGSVETARAIARHHKAGFVVLDAERQIARVVFGSATVDFALQEGENLEADLKRRDFTINAIAYSPHGSSLVDPVGGYGDLQQRRLRMISRQNLADDPLRLLRAYRQAAQLGFELEAETERAIGELSDRLGQVAAERVQSELNTLLSSAKGTPWLHRAWTAGLLRPWLPDLDAQRLGQVAQLDALEPLLQECWPALLQPPPSFLKSSLGKQGCIPLAKLVSLGANLPEAAESQVQRLKYSRLEMRAAGTVRRLQPQLRPPLEDASAGQTLRAVVQPSAGEQLLQQAAGTARSLSIRDQYFLFQNAGDLFPILILVELAQQLQAPELAPIPAPAPTQSPWPPAPSLTQRLQASPLLPLIDRYLDPQDATAHPRPLLSGKALMQTLALTPGPQVGLLLTELQIAQAEGQVETIPGAIAWLLAHQARPLS
ncbi:MAG: CCA tRNA nucleotidyltransferase [Synechococcales cyanobacterium RM1_1_8]|nr:CCA tRNA nucleotidyltransferase [Synechococcales cyanobacterium RM1_1_8]